MESKNDYFQRINEDQQKQLARYNVTYGIPYKTLISKALKFAFKYPEKVWGVK